MIQTHNYKNLTRNFVGGVKQKDTNLTSWQAVYKMISVPGASISVISYSSIAGFIFKLDVPEDPTNSEFLGLNDDGTAFNKPIYSLVFKFAILSKSDKDILRVPLEIYESGKKRLFEKEIPTLREFMYEAHIQQEIYKTTLYPVGRPITIGIIDFAYFDRIFAVKLIQKLKTLQNKDTIMNTILNYLANNITGDRMLGLITMDLVNSDFIQLYKVVEEIKNNAIIASDFNYSIAQLLLLFTKARIINYDCHSGNILASAKLPSPPINEVPEARSVLIDFGRVLRLNGAKYEKLEPQIRSKYDAIRGPGSYGRDITEMNETEFTDLYVTAYVSIDIVIERMHKIVIFISCIDYIMNDIYYGISKKSDIRGPQMLRILKYLYSDDISSSNWSRIRLSPYSREKYAAIIPLFYDLTRDRLSQRNLLSKKSIEENVKNESIFTINQTGIYNQSSDNWIPSLNDDGTSPVLLRQRRTQKPPLEKNCSEKCDPDKKESCCERVTKNIYKAFGYKTDGGKTRNKNKNNNKNNNKNRNKNKNKKSSRRRARTIKHKTNSKSKKN